MMVSPPDAPTRLTPNEDGRPQLAGRFGSLDAFWRLIEPILAHLQPRRVCEVGVEKGIFTARLLAWGRENGCDYVGIDPAATPEAAALIAPPDRLLPGRSLDLLPDLAPCGAYFLDGDHNHHTLLNELRVIQRATLPLAGQGAGPVIFLHDVSWPWARRDMYHDPASIPAEARHPFSETLGIPFDGGELIDGGFRSPGQYAVASHGGGPRNGVLTAVEDFLAGDTGQGWEHLRVPAAYGLGILYRPGDGSLPPACREHLAGLRAALTFTGAFLESCEANFLTLYLYAEHTRYERDEERRGHFNTLEAYRALEQAMGASGAAHQDTLAAYRDLEGAARADGEAHARTLEAYRKLAAHNDAASQAYADLTKEYQTLLDLYHELRRHADALAAPRG